MNVDCADCDPLTHSLTDARRRKILTSQNSAGQTLSRMSRPDNRVKDTTDLEKENNYVSRSLV